MILDIYQVSLKKFIILLMILIEKIPMDHITLNILMHHKFRINCVLQLIKEILQSLIVLIDKKFLII
nr:MAG TPA: hypothetical protein [Caudoviricetes sp.]